MSDLREQLAPKLHRIVDSFPAHSISVGCAHALADECIRQMKWARTRQWINNGRIEDGDWGTPWHVKPLTAAPDDWTP